MPYTRRARFTPYEEMTNFYRVLEDDIRTAEGIVRDLENGNRVRNINRTVSEINERRDIYERVARGIIKDYDDFQLRGRGRGGNKQREINEFIEMHGSLEELLNDILYLSDIQLRG